MTTNAILNPTELANLGRNNDTRQWQAWIDLFSDDGIYWMPPDASYKTWDGQPAIFAEDKNLMQVRMGRVLHPDAWSQRPLWGTNHVVSNVVIRKTSAKGDVEVTSTSPFLFIFFIETFETI